MTFYYGEQYIANSEAKSGIWITNPVIEKIGLKTGDKIIAVDGKPVEKFDDINGEILLGKEVTLERAGKVETIKLPVDFIAKLMDGGKITIASLRLPFIVSEVPSDSQNKNNLKEKDILTSLNGKPIAFADEAIASLDELKGKTVPAIVKRDNKEVPVNLVISDSAKLGIAYAAKLPYSNIEKLGLYKVSKETYSFAESIPVGIEEGKEQLVNYGKQLKMIFNPSTGAYKGVGGFAAIYNIFPDSWSWEVFWSITALLSIMLGVMNLLPIPALDGGHVMFLLYEIVSGKKPSDKFLENAQMVGFFLLITLLLFANGNDIYKAIVGK